MAGWGRRVAALFVDWFASLAIAGLLSEPLGWDTVRGRSLGPILVLFVVTSLLVGLLGTSLGHRQDAGRDRSGHARVLAQVPERPTGGDR